MHDMSTSHEDDSILTSSSQQQEETQAPAWFLPRSFVIVVTCVPDRLEAISSALAEHLAREHSGAILRSGIGRARQQGFVVLHFTGQVGLSSLFHLVRDSDGMLDYVMCDSPALTTTITSYQEAVKRTSVTTDPHETMILSLIGLFDELGEVAGPLKKHLWHGHEVDRAHLREEIGDVLWYLAMLCNALGIELEEAQAANLAKLQKRYPAGFSQARSIQRDQHALGPTALP